MTAFAHVDHPAQHPGVARGERLAEVLLAIGRNFDSSRAGATLLLAAMVAALIVVTNQVIETWTDGHLLAAWIVMWAVVFAALGLLAAPAARMATQSRVLFQGWLAARRQRASDDEMWIAALRDSRQMADIDRALMAAPARDIRRYY
jgi:hypothetical protein